MDKPIPSVPPLITAVFPANHVSSAHAGNSSFVNDHGF